MTTTPLPPLPEPFEIWANDEIGRWIYGYHDDQMQTYASKARADLEAENKRLREALQFAVDEQFGDVPARYPLSQWIVDAQKVLEGRK